MLGKIFKVVLWNFWVVRDFGVYGDLGLRVNDSYLFRFLFYFYNEDFMGVYFFIEVWF